jgi:hypothetical protein
MTRFVVFIGVSPQDKVCYKGYVQMLCRKDLSTINSGWRKQYLVMWQLCLDRDDAFPLSLSLSPPLSLSFSLSFSLSLSLSLSLCLSAVSNVTSHRLCRQRVSSAPIRFLGQLHYANYSVTSRTCSQVLLLSKCDAKTAFRNCWLSESAWECRCSSEDRGYCFCCCWSCKLSPKEIVTNGNAQNLYSANENVVIALSINAK